MDIRIQPDAEMRQNRLLNTVYTKLHKALFDLQARDIGVSFPEYRVILGRVIRLHATAARLEDFQQHNWLGGMAGYCQLSAIQPVPDDVKHRTVSRLQTKMSPAKMRRLLKRGSLKQEEVKAYRDKMFTLGLDNPYFELVSTSRGEKYRRYIQHGEILTKPVSGEFDFFGLSKKATIPWF